MRRRGRHASPDAVPLSSVPNGAIVRLTELRTGRGMVRHLGNLGLLPGVQVEVLRASSRGPMIVKVKGSKVMLGRGMAHGIMVAVPHR